MYINEAINEVFPARPEAPIYITRKKWSYPTCEPDGGVKLLPSDSPDGMIACSEANGKENPRGGWQPTAEDLMAEDWIATW